jgi:serine/threonine-protein phosphatase 6 regulatory subunit 3
VQVSQFKTDNVPQAERVSREAGKTFSDRYNRFHCHLAPVRFCDQGLVLRLPPTAPNFITQLNPFSYFLPHIPSCLTQVTYLVEDAPQDADAKRQFKYPFAACEIFCCEVEGVYNTLLENDELLDRLFGLLDQQRPLNTMLAGYFARVVGSLLLRRSADLMIYLQRRQALLPKLVHHVDTTSVAEVLARLVGADDPQGYPSTAALQWLAGTDLLGLLVEALGPSAPAEGQANAAEVVAAVARSVASPLTRSMVSGEFMERLVDAALAPHDGRAATHALNVCIALLEPLPPTDQNMQMGGGNNGNNAGGTGNSSADIHQQLRAEAIRCVAAAADRLVALLDDSAVGSGELRTSYGLVRTPVGQLRLKAVDLIAALLRTADSGAEAAIMKTVAIQKTMDLFLAHPFNNALHGGVAALLTSFEPGTDDLREFLLKDAKLVDWLVNAPENVVPEPNPDALVHIISNGSGGTSGNTNKNNKDGNNDNGSSAASGLVTRERPPLRAGYCGHLTQIANRLYHLSESSALVRDFLDSHAGWHEHIRTRLEPRNKLESVFAWQCGRPATLGGDHHLGGGGDSMYQGDLSFTTLDTASFNREVYQRYGVYEDDDEEEESTPPEWVMEIQGAGGGGVNVVGGIGEKGEEASFAVFNEHEQGTGDGSGERGNAQQAASNTEKGNIEAGEEEPASSSEDVSAVTTAGLLGVGGLVEEDLGGLGPDNMSDMQDDEVVLDDEDDDEDNGIGGTASKEAADAAEGLMNLQGSMAGLSVKEEIEEDAAANGPSSSAAAVAEQAAKEDEDAATASANEEYNSAVFWKNTYAVPIDDNT